MLFPKKNEEKGKTESKIAIVNNYRGNRFIIDLPEGWADKTSYTLVGPIMDEIQHNIVITVEENMPFDSVIEYADLQITTMEESLQACRLLKREEISLNNGMPAYRAIFSWYPTNTLRIYQDHIFILYKKIAYKLVSTFSKKTRKILGPQIEQSMLNFQPDNVN